MTRQLSVAILLVLAAAGVPSGATAAVDLTTPEAQLLALRRIQCSAIDGKAETFYWKGTAWSRVPGEPDRQLFRVEGMNVRQCGPMPKATNKAEFRLVGREILLYEDPVTGAVLNEWTNPWTGKTVEVIHVANDPVNGNYSLVGRDGQPTKLPFESMGNQWWLSMPIPLFYTNPLGGDYQRYVGGTYHVTELFNFLGAVSDLEDRRKDSVASAVSWQRISPWLPWMEMGDRPGIIYFHTAGLKLAAWDDLPTVMKAEIERRWPEYRNPPPLDDSRPNETSWTYFKKALDARKPAH